MPLYSDIHGRKIVYWLSQIGFGAGPLILSWINEICSDDTEKRALLVAAGNDFAYVVQAVAPNFVWKTTDFPAARKGYTWSLVLQILLRKSRCHPFDGVVSLTGFSRCSSMDSPYPNPPMAGQTYRGQTQAK